MKDIFEIVETMKSKWDMPSKAIHKGGLCPFDLKCEFSESAAVSLPDRLTTEKVDPGLLSFWSIANSASLFKDVNYGQWGLEILSPAQALEETERRRIDRPADYLSSDLVIGKFVGDSDLLVLDSSAAGCKVLVSLLMYRRDEWPVVANSFTEFLECYVSEQGEKYWER